jgi:hypothetical protein
MKSQTLPSFWENYRLLNKTTRLQAKKAYRLWLENPYHPSLRFKCINHNESVWSVRINKNYRALGIYESNTVTWFWIGNHDNYEAFFG